MSTNVSTDLTEQHDDFDGTITKPLNIDGVIPDTPDNTRLEWSAVREAINTQARVIHALMMRETISRYGDHKLGFCWAIIEPLFFIMLIGGTMAFLRNDSPSGMPLVPFMITGFVPFIMFRNTMNQLKGAVSGNRSLLGFPQVTLFDAIVARVLLEGA